MKKIYLFAIALLITTSAILTGCAEDMEIEFQGFEITGLTGQEDLTCEHVAGQGMLVSAKVHNMPEKYTKAGFRVTNYNTAYNLISTEEIVISNFNDFSTLVKMASPLKRDFRVYAFVESGGKELHSKEVLFTLDGSYDPDIIIESIETKNIAYDYEIRGEIILKGQGFTPYSPNDYNPNFSYNVHLNPLSDRLQMYFIKSSETEAHINFICPGFGTYKFQYESGSKKSEVQSFSIEAPNYIISPSHKLRGYDLWYPEFLNDIACNALFLELPYNNPPVYMPNQSRDYPWIIAPNNNLKVSITQTFYGHDTHVPIEIEFEDPWVQAGKLSENDYINTSRFIYQDGRFWFADYYNIYYVDKDFTLHTVETPDVKDEDDYYMSPTVFGSNDESVLVLFEAHVTWAHSRALYRYYPDGNKWVEIEPVHKVDGDPINIVYADGDNIVCLSSAGKVVTNYVTGEKTVTKLYNYQQEGYYAAARHGSIIYTLERGDLDIYDMDKDVRKRVYFPELFTYHQKGQYVAPMFVAGDWLYFSGRPFVRVNVASGNYEIENMGCPVDHVLDGNLVTVVDGDVYLINNVNKKIYKYIE